MPDSGEITGISTSQPSAGDIFLTNAGLDFVQVGWYLGSASGLPYTTTPRYFSGEYDPTTGGEVLLVGPTISFSTYHTFVIKSNGGAGDYAFYMDSVLRNVTTRNHAYLGHAAFNGEVDNTCVRMGARSYRPSPPLATLQYMTTSSGVTTQHYFTDHYYQSSDGIFVSDSAGDHSTDYAYGG